MIRCFVGLGSNLDQPISQVRRAFDELAELPASRLVNCSSLYCSSPVGPQDQDDFINAAVELETTLSALDLLDELQAIEQKHERKRVRHWGPRTLDLDLLLYGEQSIENERLTVPHVELCNRQFALLPLIELEQTLSVAGLPLSEHLKRLPDQGVKLL